MKLTDILKQIIQEEKSKRDRCLRIADRKFNKPSAYKSGAVVRCRQGKIWKGLKENHKAYAKERYEADLIEGKVGNLYHSTNATAATNILKEGYINPANINLKQYIGTSNPPWWYSDEFGEPQPLYGDFIYAASNYKEGFFGVSNPEVTFIIDGDKVKNSGIDIYKAPESMEKGVCLIQGSVSLKFINKIIINGDLIDEEDKINLILIIKNKKIKYDTLLKEDNKPSAYKSGAVVRCRQGKIWKGLKEEKEQNIQDLAYQQTPGLLEKGIEDELNFLSDIMDETLEGVKQQTNPQIKRVPLSSIKPSQFGEDYKNPSSEYEAKEFQKILDGSKDVADHREEDFHPIMVNRLTNKIVDGNHRHYALSTINSPYAVVLYVDVPREYLSEAEKETLRTWFKRKGAPGKTGGWVDCNSPIRKDGKITGYKPCGRQKGEERAKYPSCRPTAARCKDKGKGTKWGKTK